MLNGGYNNSFISNISGIKGKNIEVLNISLLNHVSSDQLYDTITTLPCLKEIVGFEVINAEMCSDELIQYCNEHGIKHPFTEKSMTIKRELQRIVAELITPDMDDFQKIKELSIYIMEKMEYDHEVADYNYESSDDEKHTSQLLNIGWGENLFYSVIEGIGVCSGYSEFAEALFTEANVECYKLKTPGHEYNLVKIYDVYYEIDLTSLDSFLNYIDIPISEYSFRVDALYYLTPVESDVSYEPLSEPYEATVQRDSSNTPEEDTIENDSSSTLKYNIYSISNNSENPTQNSQQNSTIAFKFMSILVAMGIARRVSPLEIEKIKQRATCIEKTSPFWTTEELKDFFDKAQTPKEKFTGMEH